MPPQKPDVSLAGTGHVPTLDLSLVGDVVTLKPIRNTDGDGGFSLKHLLFWRCGYC